MKKSRLLFFMFLIGILAVVSCDKEDDTVDDTLDCATVTFSTDIAPIIANSCATSGCHDASALAAVGDYTTYAGLETKAKDGTMEEEVITSKTMPKSGSLTQAELNKFQCWLDGGALDN